MKTLSKVSAIAVLTISASVAQAAPILTQSFASDSQGLLPTQSRDIGPTALSFNNASRIGRIQFSTTGFSLTKLKSQVFVDDLSRVLGFRLFIKELTINSFFTQQLALGFVYVNVGSPSLAFATNTNAAGEEPLVGASPAPSGQLATVPEPAGLTLLGIGALALLRLRRR